MSNNDDVMISVSKTFRLVSKNNVQQRSSSAGNSCRSLHQFGLTANAYKI